MIVTKTLWERIGAELQVSPQLAKEWGYTFLYSYDLDPWVLHFLVPAMKRHFTIFKKELH